MATEAVDLDSINEKLEEGYFPQWAFGDDDVYELEQERIFTKTWQYIGHETEIPEPGDYAVRYMVDNPLIFIRGEDGEIHVFYNSCRHRGVKLCETESGNTSHFRCPYHGWTYRNTGELVGLPQKNRVYPGLDQDEWDLFELPRVESYKGLVFAAMDEDIPDLTSYVGEDFKQYIDLYYDTTEQGIEVIGKPWRWTGEYNWKVGVENTASDSYHGPVAHASADEAGVLRGFSQHVERYGRRLVDTDGPTAGMFTVAESSEFEDGDIFWNWPPEVTDNLSSNLEEYEKDLFKRTTFANFMLFPNLTFVHVDGVRAPDEKPYPFPFIRLHRPLGPQETEIWLWATAPKEAPEEFKEEVYKTLQATFSPSGTIIPDDIAAWEGVTNPAGSQIAKKHEISLNAQMGREEISGELEIAEDWEGPGVAGDDNISEIGIRRFHRMWYNTLSEENLEDVSWDVDLEEVQ